MTNRLRLGAQAAAVGVVLALLGLLVWKVAFGGGSEVGAAIARGGRPVAPEFTLARLDRSGTLSLSSLRGKAVVLNFWASWCIPCREETPLLEAGWRRWRNRGVVFVGLNTKDFRADARAFMRRYDVSYPVVYDGKGSMVGRYGVTGFPETYFLDARGRVVYRIVGAVRQADELDAAIERALASA